jgi:hypothetical protein
MAPIPKKPMYKYTMSATATASMVVIVLTIAAIFRAISYGFYKDS